MESVFLRLLDMSLLSSYCIVIVLLIRLLLRKSPKVFSYILWIAVFVRLAFPLMAESPISLVPQSINSQSVVSWFSKEDAQTAKYAPSLSNEISKDPLTVPTDDKSPIVQTAAGAAKSASDQGSAILTVKDRSVSVPFVLSIIWVTGMAALAAYNLGVYRHLKRQLKFSLHVEKNIFESSSISSPFVLGIFRPAVYLPAGLQDSDRTYILRHEQIHIRRGDYAVKIIFFAITCVHWFNPLVWLAFALMSRDMEMSCDEKVIRDLGYDIRKNYSASLLSLATGRNLLHATPLAFGGGNIKGRIRNVLRCRKPALWIVLGSAVVVVCVVVGLILNPLKAGNSGKADEISAENTMDTSAATSVASAETTTEPTAPTPGAATSAPAETTITLDARYDNWFIDVGGKQVSFREVLALYGDSNPFSYRSPADYKTTAPVDVSNFEAVFTDSGYSVLEAAGIADESYVSGWMAVSPDGKDTITCGTFPTEAAANLNVCQFAVRWYYDYEKTNSTAVPLETRYTDSALVIYDAGNLAGDDYFLVSYLSGKSVIHAKIYVEAQRLQNFFTSMVNLGIPFPGMTLNQQEITWPQDAVLGSSAAFLDYLTQRGYSAYESPNKKGYFHGESDDLNFQVDYRPIPDKNYADWFYLLGVTGVYSTYLDYYSTDTYQMIVQGSSSEYLVSIFIDDVMIDAWVNVNELPEADAVKMREEVDTVISDLSFPK